LIARSLVWISISSSSERVTRFIYFNWFLW
jgi:hypothetical protein